MASKRVSKRQDATYHSRAKYTAQGCGKLKCKRVDRYLTKNAHAMYNLYSQFLCHKVSGGVINSPMS